MDPDRVAEIASEGGRAAHEQGTAHEFTSAEASEAGKAGAATLHKKGKASRFTSEQARAAAYKSWETRRARKAQETTDGQPKQP
jgi:uncharacterized protein